MAEFSKDIDDCTDSNTPTDPREVGNLDPIIANVELAICMCDIEWRALQYLSTPKRNGAKSILQYVYHYLRVAIGHRMFAQCFRDAVDKTLRKILKLSQILTLSKAIIKTTFILIGFANPK